MGSADLDISRYSEEIRNLIEETTHISVYSDRIREVCEILYERALSMSDDALAGFSCFTMARGYYRRNDMTNFYKYIITCIPPLERAGEWGMLVMADNMLGIISLNQGNAPFAMDYYLRSLKIIKDKNVSRLYWTVYLNMGSVYLSAGDYKAAKSECRKALDYIDENRDEEGYKENLTAALTNTGKAYLGLNDKEGAGKCEERIMSECLTGLQEPEKIAPLCFAARYYKLTGQTDKLGTAVGEIDDLLKFPLLIMDLFDDLYEYMEMLLDAEYDDDLKRTYKAVSLLTEKTNVRNLEKRLLELKIEYLKRRGKDTRDTLLKYADLSLQISKDNKLMVSNMISIRRSLEDLQLINFRMEKENAALHEISETDALTGLGNRFSFDRYWDWIFRKCRKEKSSLAIEILDIDFFKEFNDNYGHQAGDKCISEVAGNIRTMENGRIRGFRYGGDEFVLIYENYEPDDLEGFAKKLRQSIAEKDLRHDFSKVSDHVTISQGIIYGRPAADVSPADFLKEADINLYEVKKKMRDSYLISEYRDQSRFS